MLAPANLDPVLQGLHKAPRWYVALSGGIDSTVLLHLLQRWATTHAGAPPLSAIHINHGLQAQADRWQSQCEQLCAQLAVPCISHTVAVAPGASVEGAARDARYAAFESQLQPGEVLFMAHHLDDQVETFFLRLMRGAGLDGLSGMPAERPLGAGQLVRPLLHVTREMIERYAVQEQLERIEDPSNADTALDRNFLRHEVLPLLAQRWPAYRSSVSRASDHLGVARDLLQEAYTPTGTLASVTGDPGIPLTELVDATPEAAALTLRTRLRLWGLRAPGQAQLQEFLRQLGAAAPDGCPQLHWDGQRMQRYGEGVYLLPPAPSLPGRAVVLQPGERVEVPGVGHLSLQPTQGTGLALEDGAPLEVRWRQPGAQCRPVGRPASSLKKLLQEWRVPPWWRDFLPLLYCEQELLAVADLALCQCSWLAQAESAVPRWKFVWERPFSGLRD